MRNHTGQGRAGQGAGSSERLIAPCTRRHWLHAGGLLLLGGAAVPMLAGCQPVPAAPLALGLNAWVGYDPLVLARERGLIDTRAIVYFVSVTVLCLLESFRQLEGRRWR